MNRSAPLVLLMLIACGGSPATKAPRAHDSVSLQALKHTEDERFARATADEPPSARLEVERVSPSALVDRTRGLVYVLKPQLVALDLQRGVERWKLGVTGDSLTRLGPWLVVLGADAPTTPRIVLVAPDTGRQWSSCPLTLPLPPEADVASIEPFDRAGAPHVFWRGAGTLRRGGTPHTAEERRRWELGQACGVAAFEPKTCALTRSNLRDFVMQPARDYGGVHADSCKLLSPALEMPAIAASTPPPLDARRVPSVHVVASEAPPKNGQCSVVVKRTLEARGDNDQKLWQLALPDVNDENRCPGPP